MDNLRTALALIAEGFERGGQPELAEIVDEGLEKLAQASMPSYLAKPFQAADALVQQGMAPNDAIVRVQQWIEQQYQANPTEELRMATTQFTPAAAQHYGKNPSQPSLA